MDRADRLKLQIPDRSPYLGCSVAVKTSYVPAIKAPIRLWQACKGVAHVHLLRQTSDSYCQSNHKTNAASGNSTLDRVTGQRTYPCEFIENSLRS
jgi:hypothetical protein